MVVSMRYKHVKAEPLVMSYGGGGVVKGWCFSTSGKGGADPRIGSGYASVVFKCSDYS